MKNGYKNSTFIKEIIICTDKDLVIKAEGGTVYPMPEL